MGNMTNPQSISARRQRCVACGDWATDCKRVWLQDKDTIACSSCRRQNDARIIGGLAGVSILGAIVFVIIHFAVKYW